MKTAIVILNYNGIKWLKKFIPTVVEHSKNDADIFVIDNGSEDESISYLEQSFSLINIISLQSNLGFAGGYNEGLKNIDHNYYILLNSDIEVTDNWISPIISILENNASVSAIQPKILSYNEKKRFEYAGAAGGYMDRLGYPFCRGRVFQHTEIDNHQYDEETEIFWASGACIFIRSKDFHMVGGFDEQFFAHMEEIDLCWRLKNLDKKIVFSAASTVYHVGGGTLNYMSPTKTYLNFRNSLFTIHKNDDRNLFIILFFRMVLDGIAFFRFLLSGQFNHSLSILKAHFSYYKMIKTLNLSRNKSVKKPYKKMTGVINKFIIWEYFIKRKKTFKKIKL